MEGHKGFDNAAQWFPALNDLKKCWKCKKSNWDKDD